MDYYPKYYDPTPDPDYYEQFDGAINPEVNHLFDLFTSIGKPGEEVLFITEVFDESGHQIQLLDGRGGRAQNRKLWLNFGRIQAEKPTPENIQEYKLWLSKFFWHAEDEEIFAEIEIRRYAPGSKHGRADAVDLLTFEFMSEKIESLDPNKKYFAPALIKW